MKYRLWVMDCLSPNLLQSGHCSFSSRDLVQMQRHLMEEHCVTLHDIGRPAVATHYLKSGDIAYIIYSYLDDNAFRAEAIYQ